jgi:hypothetical protein
VILDQPSFHAEPRSSYPYPTEEGAAESTHKDWNQGRKDSAQSRLRPLKDFVDSSGEDPEQDESYYRPESPAPQEGVPYMYISIRSLADQSGAAETSPLQLSEGSASFISFCEVAYEDSCFHSLSLCHCLV